MQLQRMGPPGNEQPVVRVDDAHVVDVADDVGDFDEEFFASGGIERLRGLVSRRVDAGQVRELDGVRVGPPISRPQQILCIGMNYSDHAAETGQTVPPEPILFTKAPNTMVGPNDDLLLPRGSTKTDWEVELGVVVGRRALYLEDEDAARACIAGYVLVNDVSERAFQLERGGQWVKGKSAPTFNPCGPWLATPDEVDPAALDIWLDVNGVRRQSSSTANMVFGPAFLVHYLSQFMALEPGDLINTGTPGGVGLAFDPPIYLRDGDVVELGISGLGTQRQCVRAGA